MNDKQPPPALLVVAAIKATDVNFPCPHCGASQGGWCVDPRGREEQCDDCGGRYLVSQDAKISLIR